MIFGSLTYASPEYCSTTQSTRTESGLLKGWWLSLAEVRVYKAFLTGRQLLKKAAPGSLET